MSEWHHGDEERLIVRVLVRGLLHVANQDITAAVGAVRRARLEESPEGVGSIRPLRLAIRRIEYQLHTMAEVDPSLGVATLVERLHDAGKPFGQLRDVEVIATRVNKALGESAISPEGARLLELVADDRHRAQHSSDAALDSEELRDALEALNEYRATLPSDAVTPAMARPVAQEALKVTWRSAKHAAKFAKEDNDDDLLHALRRTIKRAVYSTRGYSYVLGPSSEEFAARLVVVQKVLGRQHDRVMVAQWLASAGEQHASLEELTHALSVAERRRADHDAGEWQLPWKVVRQFHPKKTVMTTYSFFD
jgi:CHAD domain-containing protein